MKIMARPGPPIRMGEEQGPGLQHHDGDSVGRQAICSSPEWGEPFSPLIKLLYRVAGCVSSKYPASFRFGVVAIQLLAYYGRLVLCLVAFSQPTIARPRRPWLVVGRPGELSVYALPGPAAALGPIATRYTIAHPPSPYPQVIYIYAHTTTTTACTWTPMWPGGWYRAPC
jgi:hypothetical protein